MSYVTFGMLFCDLPAGSISDRDIEKALFLSFLLSAPDPLVIVL
ncbi:hypothetical protein ACRS6B_11545 [Nocardia asteroides]